MEHKKANRIAAFGVFFISLVTYVVTLSPTVVFWDVGEFCAAAFSLQVPHPPGAPLFLILARVATMIPFTSDLAVRMHFISAFASAVACMVLYLLAVRFILRWREEPRSWYDRIVVYGSAVIGALSLTFSPTFWFNAVEAEVYGMSMFFVSGIIWLGLQWYGRADEEHGDTYLLLIFYIVGLSVGVHLLALLALFPVMLLYYHKHYEITVKTFVSFGVVALAIFGVVYLGVVKALPSLLDGEFSGIKSEFFTYLPFILLAAAGYGVYESIKRHNRVLNVVLLSFLFIVLGYSTYALVYIRANAKPPMNENDPSSMARLVSYINREQYGEAPLINRRWNTEPEQRAAQQKYASDMDYFLKYQLDHMYLRYFGWNFVGSEGDFKEAGVDWKRLYGIPLLLGILGVFIHWRRDWKMASVATTAFLVLGLALVVYFNMQEPQPRERDYFYVGSFFIFSIWIAIGVLGIVDWVKERFQSSGGYALTGYGVLVLAFVLVPANMFRTNFHEANRTGNYVAWDYSYNLLQSCEKDAVLFTNGDNDTFPLWYLQDVEGIRRDVRVVCLSLLNTSWYIRQLKHEQPYGSRKITMMTPDVEIENIGPRPFEPRVIKLPVPGEVMKQYGIEGTAATVTMKDKGAPPPDTISFFMQNTLKYGSTKAIRVQDLIVFDIVASSNWERPIYFAMTVSPDGQIGLRDYLQLEGLAFRLTPKKGTSYWANINEPRMRAQLFTDVGTPSKTPSLGYRWRGLDNKNTYFDEDVRRLMTNYRQSFGLLAQYYANSQGQDPKVIEALDRMEKLIPRNVIPMDYRTKIYVANLYNVAGKRDTFTELNEEIISELTPIVALGKAEPLSYDNPYVVLMQVYESMGKFDEALKLIDQIRAVYSREPGIEQSLQQIRTRLLAEQSTSNKDSLVSGAAASKSPSQKLSAGKGK